MNRERLTIVGGSTNPDSVGSSCLAIDRRVGRRMHRIVIDAGVEPTNDKDQPKKLKRIQEISSLAFFEDGPQIEVVHATHDHNDHSGNIALLRRLGYLSPDARVLASPQTIAKMPIVFRDNIRHGAPYNMFDQANITQVRCEEVPEGEFEIIPGVPAYAFHAGHTDGNVGIALKMDSGKTVLCPSDMAFHDQPIAEGAPFPSEGLLPPEWVPDVVITDLTYAASGPRKPFDAEADKLAAAVRAATGRGRIVFIAAFRSGRGANVAAILSRAGIHCWLDGATRETYAITQEIHWSERDGRIPPIGSKSGIHYIEGSEHREAIIEAGGPAVIVTTAGMGDFGPIVRYLKAFLNDRNARFFFTSFLAPGTNGAKLVEMEETGGKRELTIVDWRDEKCTIPVAAKIRHFRLGGHCDLDETTRFVEEWVACRGGRKLDTVILYHGSHKAKTDAQPRLEPFAKRIVYARANCIIPLDR